MRNVKWIFPVLSVLLCAVCASAPAENGALASDIGSGDAEILAVLSAARAQFEVPAMAAAIVTSRGIQAAAVLGTRKWGTDTPVTLKDLWHLGSDTKIMTSTLAAVLIDQGKLSWTSTVSDIFPEMAPRFDKGFRKVTLLQLLSHQAGLPANLDYGSLGSGSVTDLRLRVVSLAMRDAPVSPPGTQYLYSNVGYIIAGAMVERASGLDWETAMTRFVFAPLGMGSAGYGGLGTPGTIDQPWGHTKARSPVPFNGPDADNPPVLGPAGRVHCTIQDWAVFIADQLKGARGEPALLKPQDYAILQNPHFGGAYALGWLVQERSWAGGKALTHTGSNTFHLAVAWVAPAKDFAILVCTNEGLDSAGAADKVTSDIIVNVVKP